MPKKSKGDAQKLIDRILDFPYRKLFGVRGQITIGTIVVFVFIIKFFSGIDTVMLDAKTCKVSIWDTPYLLFHKERILKNTASNLREKFLENQRIARHIDDGINPFKSATDGNIKRARKINPNKFVWKTMVQRVRKENLSIIRCLGKLKNYRF